MTMLRKIAVGLGFCLLVVVAFGVGFSIHALQDQSAVVGASTVVGQDTNDRVMVAEREAKPVTILAFGDMMLDRTIRKTIYARGAAYPFQNLREFMKGYDIVVANAEGTFSEFPSRTLVPDAPLQFTFATSSLSVLKETGFTLFSQSNNHTFDFGRAALNQSRYFMKQEGLATFGDPLNATGTVYTTTIQGIKVAFVGYHQFAYGLNNVLTEIRQAKEGGAFVIVYPHWGEEYNKGITSIQLERGHAFIDAGADVIIGAHPHVIEPIEIYKDKVIFYSLGNFIFDQSFSRATMEGLAISLAIEKDTVTYRIYPLGIKAGQAFVIEDVRRAEILSDLGKMSIVSDDVAREIAQGMFTIKR